MNGGRSQASARTLGRAVRKKKASGQAIGNWAKAIPQRDRRGMLWTRALSYGKRANRNYSSRLGTFLGAFSKGVPEN